MSSNVKNRIQELNNRLADTLVEKGIDASGQETTTELIEKVGQFQPGEIPEGYIKPEGSMPITENGTFDVREKAEVNVQVVAKPEKPYIDSSKLKSGYAMFDKWTGNADLSLFENLDTSGMVNIQNMFRDRTELTGDLEIDTKEVLDMSQAFMHTGITSLKVNGSKCTTFSRTVSACEKLTEVDLGGTLNGSIFASTFFLSSKLVTIKGLITSKANNVSGLFQSCASLVELPELDFSSVTNGNYSSAFLGCTHLTTVTFVGVIKITNNNLNFSQCSNLTVESLLSILNALSDNTGIATTYTVHLGSANIAKLTDEQLLIAYSKNIALD